jgi:hypothetical protein
MQISLFRVGVLLACLVVSHVARATTIFQAANSTYVAWEAEDVFSISNSTPTLWVATNDATASGTRALYQAGANQTAAPASFAAFAIRFRTAGDYTLHFTWRADKTFSDLDPNSANSYYRPNSLGDLGPEVANYASSAANNSRQPPAANTYAMSVETVVYSVTQPQVDAGVPLVLKFGTREAGMFIDRIVLSQVPLTESEFNALPNSDTDIVAQGASENYVAFEAERVSKIVNATPTLWITTNDATASGNQALYQAGANQTAAPASFAAFALRFRTAGDYTLHFTWRADKAFSDLDPNSANSYYRPNSLGDLGPEVANYASSAANNSRQPPAANTYAMSVETVVYSVTQPQVDAGVPLVLKFGTREAGMFIDRIILSQVPLTESEFNALPNSGSVARPTLVKAVGSAGLTNVTVKFDRPLNPASVIPARFALSGGVAVTAAVLDVNTSKDVILTTSVQLQNSNYVVTVNGVTDVLSNAIAANSRIAFTSWRLATGWITRDLYYDVSGLSVGDLIASPNYPDRPSVQDFVKTASIGSDLQLANYGSRFRAFFIPPQSGNYEFYLYADDEAWFSISTDPSAENLAFSLGTTGASTAFDPVTTATVNGLVGGQRYLFEVLHQQGNGAAAVGLGARRVGTPGNVEDIPLLGGSQVATFIDPDAAAVNIQLQPASGTVPAGQRARLTVRAIAPKGGTLLYQWQVDGADIPGATRPTYVTPILASADNGKKFRCVVGVNGVDVPSQEAIMTVGPAQFIPLVPYVGVNFSGGGDAGTTIGAALATNDIAGAVLQGNFNNIPDAVIDGTHVLRDADGVVTPVTIAVWDAVNQVPIAAGGRIGIGTGAASAEHVMFQGTIANNNTPVSLRLGNVPPGTYNLVVYSVGFSFNSTYEEDFTLVGGGTYPTLTVRGQSSLQFLADPVLTRMNSTDPNNRALGNYVMFENVSPAGDGTLLLTVTPQSVNIGNAVYFPPINAFQLVKVAAQPPVLSVGRQGTNVAISWTGAASGYVLQGSPAVGSGANWQPVDGTPNPITGAGSTSVAPSGNQRFFELRK